MAVLGLQSVLEMLFPPACTGCGRQGTWLCAKCAGDIPPIVQAVEGAAVSVRAVASYENKTIRTLLHHLKYLGVFAAGDALVNLLPERRPAWLPQTSALVPVPSSRERLKIRGYNQAALLAGAIGKRYALPVYPHALRARGRTSSVGKDRETRLAAKSPFTWAGKALPSEHVLLVDDTYTTGSTISACVEALRPHVASLQALVFAYVP